ncbi:MAG TPA: hypothetical protein VMW20_09045 [Candidatus Nanoarchaeia archaeon]|nr:hypothetical protein [Candidatus Nanoarchaeia archaeon]
MVGKILNGWGKNWSLFGSDGYYGNYDCENPCLMLVALAHQPSTTPHHPPS